MKLLGRAAVLVALLGISPGAEGAPRVQDLTARLSNARDFRVRLQAALELGKSNDAAARPALEEALEDENSAVRAAAAAGLKVLADPAAIPALRAHASDSAHAVRAQIRTTLEALQDIERVQAERAARPEVMVEVGKIRFSSRAGTNVAAEDVEQSSRRKLRQLPGVVVMDCGQTPSTRKGSPPVVMVTGRVKQLEEAREGSSVVYLASVEFVLHKMPGQTIKGVVSGSARASGSLDEMRDQRALADLRRTALEAAIDSAVRRAPQALRAAAQ